MPSTLLLCSPPTDELGWSEHSQCGLFVENGQLLLAVSENWTVMPVAGGEEPFLNYLIQKYTKKVIVCNSHMGAITIVNSGY